MDTYYNPREKRNSWLPVVLILMVFLIIGYGAYLAFGQNKKVLSPIPAKPDFELIFYSPTPSESVPTMTPTVTPKQKKGTAAAPTPTTAAKSSSPTPTVKATPKPTVKPTAKPSVTPAN